MRHCTVISTDSFIVTTKLLSDGQIASFDGILLVDVQPPNGVIGVDCPINPKWDGQKWVEGATQQEINDFNTNKPTPQPSEIEVLSNYVLDVDMRLIMVELGM